MSENLQIKIVAETGSYKKDIQDAKKATREFGNETKTSASKMESLKAQIEGQKAKLATLKEKYDKLITSQKGSVTATKELEMKMKLLNTQIDFNEQKLKIAAAANNELTNSFKHTGSVGAANTDFSQLGDTLANIRNLQMADVFITMFAAFAETRDEIGAATSAFAQAFEEIIGAFNFKNMDVGGDGIKGFFESMKIQGREAIKSLSTGFKNLGGAIKAAMTSATAAIAATIAVLVTFIALLGNAITTAQRLRQVFYEAQKIGMSATAYEEWAYVLNHVGVGVDKLSDFLKTLADEQNAVRDGSEDMIKAFEAIGLSAEEVSSMSQEKLFSKTVSGLQGIENQVQRTSIAYRIFGEDAAELTNVINLNNEEMEQMLRNYYLLGGSASDSAIEKSLTLSAAVNDLKTAWKGLTNTLGEAFMPMITSVVKWLTKAVAVVNMFIRAMLGYDIIAKGSKSTEKAANSMSSYKNAVDKATQSTEKLKRTTQGFDELNIVADLAARSNASAGVANTGSYGGGFEVPEFDLGLGEDLGLEKFAEDMERFKEIIRNVMPWALVGIGILLCFLGGPAGWITGLSLIGLGIAVGIESGAWAEQFTALGEGIKGVWQNIKAWFVENVAPVFTKDYWKEKWKNIKEAVAMSAIGQAISDGWDDISKWFVENVKPIFTKDYWKQKWEAIREAVAMSAVGQAISNGWDDIVKWYGENVAPVFTKEYWKQKWENIRSATSQKIEEVKGKISEKWEAIKKWFAENVKPIFTIAYWKQKWEAIRTAADQKIEEIKGKLDEKWKAIKKWFADTVAPVFTKKYWSQKWETIKQNALTGIDNIGTAIFGEKGWGKIKKSWAEKVAPIFTKNYWVQKWNTAKQGAIEGVKSFINGIIEKIESGINSIIRKINGIGKINMPSWLGGGSFGGFNLKTISIPRLATGGITNGSTLANIGENGREAVLPLENNTDWMDMLADRLASRIGGDTKVVLQVGEKELGWATINSINGITKQTGGLQLHLV